MRYSPLVLLILLGAAILFAGTTRLRPAFGQQSARKKFVVHPIGWIQKSAERTTIVVDEEFVPGLMGLDKCSHVWVLYWFDRNDTPKKRSILKVHPQGDKNKPLRGVFATHSPVRPNLIAMSRCKVISVKENVVEIEEIDAFPDTPVLDLKSG